MSEVNSKKILGEQYFNQVTESLQNVFELSTRIDERVQIMMKKQSDLELKIESSMAQYNQLSLRTAILEQSMSERKGAQEKLEGFIEQIHALEIKIIELEGNAGISANRWSKFIEFVLQTAVVVFSAWLMIKFGFGK